jgi:predicted HTH domain antitoxin
MVMRQIVVNVPEQVLLAEKMDEVEFGQELRTLAALKLYELGRLSSGRAADLAGMSRIDFLLALRRYKVFPFESELRDLEAEHG